MLRRVGASRYQGQAGTEVTIVVVAQNNDGTESAVFQYGDEPLEVIDEPGHPACRFVMQEGRKTLGVSVLFSPGNPAASYDLFEQDDNEELIDLDFSIEANFGPIAHLRLEGEPPAVPALAARKAKKAKRAKKAKAAKTAKTARKATRTTRSKKARTHARKSSR